MIKAKAETCGDEMAEVLMSFPQLTMTLSDGREESIMSRTTLVSLTEAAWLTRLRASKRKQG